MTLTNVIFRDSDSFTSEEETKQIKELNAAFNDKQSSGKMYASSLIFTAFLIFPKH